MARAQLIGWVCIGSLCLSLPGLALGQPAAPQPAPTSAPADTSKSAPSDDERPEPSEADKEEAKKQFKKGIDLMSEKAFGPALAAFQRSRDLYPRKSSTRNMAFCLRQLQRYDEALAVYEALLRDFTTVLTPEEKREAQEFVAEMSSRVGTIEVINAEIGAGITLDGQTRGEFPAPAPIRAASGNHTLRVYKEGYEPFETLVDVNGGESKRVEVRLRPLQESGRLRVIESTGRTVDVIVDGTLRGQTPWEGRIDVGRHTITLVGQGLFGTQPASALVKSNETQVVNLRAENLDSSLRVEPTPADARIAIDGVDVGAGSWVGRLKSGKHTIEAFQDGFVSKLENVVLEPGTVPRLKLVLERDSGASRWKKPSKWALELTPGFIALPSFGGDVAGTSCETGCNRSFGMGGLGRFIAVYEIGGNYGIGLEGGYFVAAQTIEGRTTSITPKGLQPQTGTVDDSLTLSGYLVGITGSYRADNEKFPWGLRIGAGLASANMLDERKAQSFKSAQTNPAIPDVAGFEANTPAQSGSFLYLQPEIYGGWKLGRHFEIGASLGILAFFAMDPPKFKNPDQGFGTTFVEAPSGTFNLLSQSVSTFPEETLTGSAFVSFVPSARVRYEF